MQHSPQEFNEREAPMTILRTLAPFLATAIALATGPAQAEMKHQWVEYSQGGTKLKAYLVYDDKVTGRRPTPPAIPRIASRSRSRRSGPSSAT